MVSRGVWKVKMNVSPPPSCLLSLNLGMEFQSIPGMEFQSIPSLTRKDSSRQKLMK